MTQREKIAELEADNARLEAENWNLKNPIGTAVDLLLDSEVAIRTKTTSQAYLLAPGYAVAFFEDVRGFYLLNRATPVPEPVDEAEVQA